MTTAARIESTTEAWEDGTLGADEAHVSVAPDMDKAIDDALGLQPISIRLQRSLLENLKALAQLNGLGYQPLIRQVLTRFVDCELKAILRDKVAREVAGSVSEKQDEQATELPENGLRKAA
jgi:hypothetical protein